MTEHTQADVVEVQTVNFEWPPLVIDGPKLSDLLKIDDDDETLTIVFT